jgi:hypothetical protein
VPDVAQITCATCGESFEPRNGNQRYCKPKCKNLGGARLRVKRNAAKTERRCYKCGTTKRTEEFSAKSHSYCRDCTNEVQREWRVANPERVKALKKKSIALAAQRDPSYYRKLTLHKFGLTLDTYEALLTSQGGRCAICGISEPGGRHGTWHVDHDRSCCQKMWSCGSCIRGVLCQNCNLLLGHAHDDTAILLAAIEYLKR